MTNFPRIRSAGLRGAVIVAHEQLTKVTIPGYEGFCENNGKGGKTTNFPIIKSVGVEGARVVARAKLKGISAS